MLTMPVLCRFVGWSCLRGLIKGFDCFEAADDGLIIALSGLEGSS